MEDNLSILDMVECLVKEWKVTPTRAYTLSNPICASDTSLSCENMVDIRDIEKPWRINMIWISQNDIYRILPDSNNRCFIKRSQISTKILTSHYLSLIWRNEITPYIHFEHSVITRWGSLLRTNELTKLTYGRENEYFRSCYRNPELMRIHSTQSRRASLLKRRSSGLAVYRLYDNTHMF